MLQTKFFADECTFGLTVHLLRNKGFSVVRAQELGMTGASDPEIYDKAQELNAVLITNDQGFSDIRKYPPSTHSGMIVLKMSPHPLVVQEVHKVLEVLFERENLLKGTLFIVDRTKYRKRMTPYSE